MIIKITSKICNRNVSLSVGSDDEEVPSRQFLKRQAQLITDSKSRRKGFRGVQFPKKK